MQWFKRFFEMSVQDRGSYDPSAQRLRGKGTTVYIYLIYTTILHVFLCV